MCPICKQKFIEHSELQDKICKMITIKQFANNCPGFDVQFRPFFEGLDATEYFDHSLRADFQSLLKHYEE
jgi:hypothetical protein